LETTTCREKVVKRKKQPEQMFRDKKIPEGRTNPMEGHGVGKNGERPSIMGGRDLGIKGSCEQKDRVP